VEVAGTVEAVATREEVFGVVVEDEGEGDVGGTGDGVVVVDGDVRWPGVWWDGEEVVKGGWGGVHECLRKCLPSMVRTVGQPRMLYMRSSCWAEAEESLRAKSWALVMGVMLVVVWVMLEGIEKEQCGGQV